VLLLLLLLLLQSDKLGMKLLLRVLRVLPVFR